ncbi:transposable element Tc1 transposase [Trichonephila clavipes]|nr:transposable element Tc1 transposase [Trichonephila clavipes]
MFSDESRFQLCLDNRRRRVWRRPGQRADSAFIIACHIDPQTGFMVRDANSFDSRTPWTIIRGTLTAQWCINDILRTILLQFLLKYIGLFFRR